MIYLFIEHIHVLKQHKTKIVPTKNDIFLSKNIMLSIFYKEKQSLFM
jgi:hypothetical protein